jgi:hypothetical protein
MSNLPPWRSPSPGAIRMRRYRKQRKQGLRPVRILLDAVAADTPTKRQRSPTRNDRIISSIGEERRLHMFLQGQSYRRGWTSCRTTKSGRLCKPSSTRTRTGCGIRLKKQCKRLSLGGVLTQRGSMSAAKRSTAATFTALAMAEHEPCIGVGP